MGESKGQVMLKPISDKPMQIDYILKEYRATHSRRTTSRYMISSLPDWLHIHDHIPMLTTTTLGGIQHFPSQSCCCLQIRLRINIEMNFSNHRSLTLLLT